MKAFFAGAVGGLGLIIFMLTIMPPVIRVFFWWVGYWFPTAAM